MPVTPISPASQTPFLSDTWGGSDEDSPLSDGVLYVTEAADVTKIITTILLSLKHAPTGSTLSVDAEKETGVNTNTFETVLSVQPTIMVNEYVSSTSIPLPVFSDNIWEAGRRFRFRLTINDSNGIASGIKVKFKF